jgi:hypothetical protein
MVEQLSDIISVVLSADQNNWDPIGNATSVIIRVDCGAANRTITGLLKSPYLRQMWIVNISPTRSLILNHESASSLAANRFHLPNAMPITVRSFGGITLFYDLVSLRWRSTGYSL